MTQQKNQQGDSLFDLLGESERGSAEAQATAVEATAVETAGPEPTESARKLAEQHKIKLEEVKGSGQNGRIIQQDVQKIVNQRAIEKARQNQKPGEKEPAEYDRDRVVHYAGHRIEVPNRTMQLEDIRRELLEPTYPELSKERTEMLYEKEKGLVIPVLKGHRKGGMGFNSRGEFVRGGRDLAGDNPLVSEQDLRIMSGRFGHQDYEQLAGQNPPPLHGYFGRDSRDDVTSETGPREPGPLRPGATLRERIEQPYAGSEQPLAVYLAVPHDSPDRPVFYMLGSDGVYEVRQTQAGQFVARVETSRDIREGFVMRTPPIPPGILRAVVELFRSVPDEEALANITYTRHENGGGAYGWMIPAQEGTASSVSTSEPFVETEDRFIVLQLHSHGTLPAFFSGTDDKDETRTGLYGVVGQCDKERPTLHLRYSVAGTYVPLFWPQVKGLFEERLDLSLHEFVQVLTPEGYTPENFGD